MKKLMIIVNPVAGRSGYTLNFGEAMKIISDAGYATTLFFTTGRGDAANYARRYANQFDIIACIGGDGTLSEMLSGLIEIDRPPKVGYFPMGTANDVATTLGLPKNDMVGAARQLIKGDPHPFDLGGFGGDEIFAYIAAFGAFTKVSYATPQNQKKALGHLAYVLQGAIALGNLEPYHVVVEYDDGTIEGSFVYGSMSNSTSVAGIIRLPSDMVCLGDGKSEIVLVREPLDVEDFGDILASVLSRTFESENLVILHTTRAKFSFDKPVSWTRDGEDGGSHTQIELVNYPHPVELIF